VAWNKEARALKAINKLNHAHIVKCIAAVRKGEKRYLMFPWAEGETLRDYWKNASTKEPSYESIRQIIAQLRGIADALTHLHDYREGRRRSLPGNSLSFTVPVVNGENTDTFGVPQLVKDHTDYDDDLNSSNSVSIRHGDLKPENILRFTESSDGLGVLKIADMGLAKQHMLLTSDRNDKRQLTSTMYGTRPYEAPETITAEYGRSRLYDVWSMGCITLEFIIWILYGNESLTDFYNDIAGGAKKLYQYYEIPDPMNHQHAEVHRVVLKWIKHIESVDPECTQKSAIRDLLAVVKDKLLVVELPPSSTNSGAGGRVLAPPALGEASRFRATAEEFRDALDDILRKADDREYVFTEKNRSDARPPTYTVSPGAAARMDGIETAALANSQGDLSNDNSFANTVIRRVDSAIFQPQVRKTPSLCARCRSLQFWTGGFSHEVIVSELLESAQTCDLCRMLHEACRDDSLSADSSVLFIRDGSNLLLAGNPSPVLSLVSVPEARITSDFQMGFPELPEPGSDAFFEILRSWLANCDTDHKDSKNLDRDCAGIPKFRLPTRLIDVGAVDAPILRLAKTQEDNIDPQAEYIALSHPWGDISEYIPFQTFWKDPKGTRHEFETFRQAIPESELPGTFRDAVICTRRLGIRYLWIDS
jgi:serine/threonine protein kinase